VQPVLMSAITAGVTAKAVDADKPTGGTDPHTAAAGPAAPPAPQTAKPGGDPGI
jgi:hypothetical protein